jgi:hypothetical protein
MYASFAYKAGGTDINTFLSSPNLLRMASNRIIQLAKIIQANTELIDAHLTSKGLPTPSFAADNPPTVLFGHGPQIESARQGVVDATDELQALMLGPTGVLTSLFVRCSTIHTSHH